LKKLLILSVSLLTLGSTILPGTLGAVAYADESISVSKDPGSNISNFDYSPKQLSEEAVEVLTNELASKYPTLSKEYLREGIYKQMRGDYSLEPIQEKGMLAARSSWQGITVNQMGAAIDTAIAVALGVGTGGLATALATVGKHEAKNAIRVAAGKFFGSWFLNSVAFDYAMNLLSPGTYIAQKWDQQDKVPNNGRINF
jgi:hypothetical protein